MTKFEEFGDQVVAAVRAGATLDESARKLGIGTRTVERWLAKGREAPAGPYGRFAAQVDAARQLQEIPGSDETDVMDRGELCRIATAAARNGSTSAMRLVHDLLPADPPAAREPDRIDQLKEKRERRLATARARREAEGK